MSSHVLLKTIALGVLTSIVSARNVAVRWSPARETGLPARGEGGGGVDYGVSPVPTQIPGARPELGGMELFKRYQIGSDTCGFAAGFKSSPWTCYNLGAECKTTGTYMDCCVDEFPACLSTFWTACADAATAPSSCGPGTLCCNAAAPSCFTWKFSTSTNPSVTYQILNCLTSGGVGTLLDAPPILTISKTTTSPSTSSSTTSDSTTFDSQTTPSSSSSNTGAAASATASPTSDPDHDKDSSPAPAGAIAGGVVGGVAIIGIAAVAIFYIFFRNKHNNNTTNPSAGIAPAYSNVPGGSFEPPKDSYPPGVYPVTAYDEQAWKAAGGQQVWNPQLQRWEQQQPLMSELPGETHVAELGDAAPIGSQAHRAELGR